MGRLVCEGDIPGGLLKCCLRISSRTTGWGQEAFCLGHWGDFGVEVERDLGLELWIGIRPAEVR